MRHRVLVQVLLLVSLLAAPALRAQTASLVADLTPQTDPSRESALPSELFSFRGKLLFSATGPGAGRELWVSDGQGRGTYLLADLCIGFCDAAPRILGATAAAVVGDARIREDFEFRTVLWRSDGTRAGTFLLPSSIDPVEVKNGPASVLIGQVLYFSGCNTAQGCGLWRSDGTAAGTRAIQVFPGTAGVSGLAAAGNRLFFFRDRTLWVTDGTAAGTRAVRELPSAAYLPSGLGNRVVFLSGDELWVSDGTAANTRALTSFGPAGAFLQTLFLKPLGGKVYFVADDGVHGPEVWATDGTQKGTRQVTEIAFSDPFAAGAAVGLRATDLELLGNRLVVWATDGIRGFQPWSTTGTPASTKPLCQTCSFTNERAALVKVGSRLLFTGRETRRGAEVWATDGTPQGTALLKDVCAGSCNGVVSEPRAFLGSAFFAAAGPGATGLWRSDGTVGGTRRIAAAAPQVATDASLGRLAALGSTVFFAGDGPDDDYGVELWASDGVPASSRLVTDAAGGNASSIFTAAAAVGRNLFFITADQTAPYQQSLWFTQGTAEGTRRADRQLGHESFLGASIGGALLLALHDEEHNREQVWRVDADTTMTQLTQIPPDVRIDEWDVLGDRLYFIPQDDGEDSGLPLEIWRSDGTVHGTVKTAALPADLYFTFFLTSVGTEICFLGFNQDGGTEIWCTVGTQTGTRKVAEFTGAMQFDPELTRVGSNLYFAGGHEEGRQIWRTDGTPEGTVMVADLDPGPDAPYTQPMPTDLTEFQGNLYFTARTPQGGRGLWRTDGTPQGTILLKEFVEPIGNDGSYRRDPFQLTAVGSWLVFVADDGAHGEALWRSDGTADGTTLLRSVNAGGFVPAAGRLYFSAHDGIHGFELWQTDGTADGTRLVQDLAPGAASSFPGYLTTAEDRLFFSADDGTTGQELWVLPLASLSCKPTDTTLCLADGRFEVKVSWRDFTGQKGSGHAVSLSGDTGYFWFFDPANVETAVKVLDGTSANGHFWVFFGALTNVEYTLTVTDTRTGLSRRYFNPKGVFASVGDTQGFGPLGAYSIERRTTASPAPVVAERIDAAAATGTCVPAAGRLCLNGGRFAVEASWKDFSNRTGAGTAVSLTGDTGYFWFFDSNNVEVVFKVLDGTPVNGHFWIYYGALTNVEYTLTVTDTVTGQVKTYKNPPGRFASAGDTSAF